MVVCKYYQQGSCKFGTYCRFEHVNNFGTPNAKPYGEGKSVVLGVAEEILSAERGGQWLLSCFGPFKEQPCIPGMEDISPEEVRWEMYQAQKNGTVDQTKLQFQQLCEEAKVKREALKNPTHETAALLEKLQKGNRDSAFSTKSSFSMSSPLANNTSGNNPFSTKTFGTSNSFMGNSAFNSTGNSSMSIFGRSATNNSSVFGGKPSFGGTPVFGGQTPAASIFGDTSKSNTSIFGGAQSMPTFSSTAQSPAFGFNNASNSQSVFSQSNSIFSNSSQSTTSAFGGNTTTASSPFSNPVSQSNPSPFGMANQNPFVSSAIQQNNSLFGASTTPVNSSVNSSSILRQPQTAFGGASVFNSSPFSSTTAAPAFGGQPTFNTPRNLFGTSTSNATFGSNVQPVNSFNALSTAQNVFTSSQNTNSPFGTISSASNSGAFGSNQGTRTGFGNVFDTSTTAATPFSQPPAFGSSITSNTVSNTFGSNNFMNANNAHKPNEPASTFGGGNSNNPFASTITSITMSNPFISQSQQAAICTGSSSTPGFGGINFACKVSEKIDESIYSLDEQLTDDEKQMYLSDQFILGKIPLNPPSIELR